MLHADVEPRYLPAVGALADLFGSDGELGPLRSLRLDHEMLLAAEYRRSSMLFGLGSWYVDLLDAVAASPASRVDLSPGKVRDDGLVVTGEARIRYESGAEATWAFGFEGPRTLGLCISASGAGGDAEADLTTGRVRRRPAGGGWTCEVIDCTRPEAGFIGMRESLGAFIAAARGQGPHIVRPGRDQKDPAHSPQAGGAGGRDRRLTGAAARSAGRGPVLESCRARPRRAVRARPGSEIQRATNSRDRRGPGPGPRRDSPPTATTRPSCP